MPAARSHDRAVAASTRTRGLVTGPRRRGRVVGVSSCAVYVAVDPRPADAAARSCIELVAVETADGVGLPCAATLAAHSSIRPLRHVRAGDLAHVGEGRLDVGPLGLAVVRWWSPRRTRVVPNLAYDAARLSGVVRSLPPLPLELADRLRALTSALLAPSPAQQVDAVTALLGLGTGLTPQGDDVLAGVLVTLAARPATQPIAHRLGDIIDRQAERTTTLSAGLLRDAADGFAVPALVDLVDALLEVDNEATTTRHRALADVVARLLAVGHTSGAGLAHGALAGAGLPGCPHDARPRRGGVSD